MERFLQLIHSSLLAASDIPPFPITVDLNKIRSLVLFIIKGGVVVAFIIVILISFIRGLIGALERSGGGSFMSSAGYREILEAFKGPIIFLLALLFLAWLPEILAWIGLLPPVLKNYAIDWRSIFGG